ncbi:4-hydroxy-3-methylbut-2-en-1-yl diphosphate synthase [Leadbetterella byssophila DSM 17132]|uniref:4-hydroxy-3-methylbut-2-en-1-yl diphosphate synthase (flavodoxin) n=1 Tax=Leadbetterella byssophila (strain DSM 17132 / JCM 16389 / KACC 11308 / NBRC 106382 / 4M15) TaxID=649349 RepID=E4RTI9_LEAB4|nr:(E)-4-hydroxy-3-methylbut-2-enyl-diphosphate synthase [Leadbetterella byssophila]ADQ16846.1 4-hydroxy-3-methylbut-2-en-1-yl diphosphate synthase [Leadbetterella byssophila DSM 17132]
MPSYCNSLTEYSRRITQQVKIGDLGLGSEYPIRIQSMTTVDTMDTAGSVAQCIRMIESGCELVRITAPSVKEAQNLENIKRELRAAGYNTPLVADIHFTPNAAELAARIVEKVRINPGNYADKKRFEIIDYTDASYAAELDRIRERFTPLVRICKEYGTAMRIGTNHGSLSDRILSRYGDTPAGMVESALEFLKICEDENYYNIVISMKSSNPQVMVHAYRLLVKRLEEEKLHPYPLHLGVTEAGEGEDGRIKSSMGIGTLLEDGLGDTVRVSLTEDPEFEAPVAEKLVSRYPSTKIYSIPAKEDALHPFHYERRIRKEVFNFGGHQVPRVIADFSLKSNVEIEDLKAIGHFYLPLPDKWKMNDLGADYIYTGSNPISFMLPNGLKEIQDYPTWLNAEDKVNKLPLMSIEDYFNGTQKHAELNFIALELKDWSEEKANLISTMENVNFVLEAKGATAYQAYRAILSQWATHPVILRKDYSGLELEEIQLHASTDLGGIFLEGFGEGIMISGHEDTKALNSLAFGILQASRTRISKTEYISCPSCGRTLFDLQETTAMIRKRTDHLKGIKIGIMGCIVNGPGEMADADYGYVGIGKDKISLYRGQQVVKRSVPSKDAVDELIQLIKEDGNWLEPEINSYE